MEIVRYSDYDAEKQSFFHRHHNNFQLETIGSSGENYMKTYKFEDGAVWYEAMSRKTIKETVSIRYCNTPISVDMLQTEYWNSEEGDSKYYYEKWDINK